jgi:hypothetical protein
VSAVRNNVGQLTVMSIDNSLRPVDLPLAHQSARPSMLAGNMTQPNNLATVGQLP